MMKSSVYAAAWNKLKSNPNAPLVIAAHPAYHRRIYKAIIKRKNEDAVFHYELTEQSKKSKLSKESEGHVLKIRLHISTHVTVESMFL